MTRNGAGGRHRRRSRIGAIVGLVVAVAVIVAGAVLLSGPRGGHDAADPVPPSVDEQVAAPSTDGDDLPLPPRTLELGAISVEAPIGVATVPGGVLTPPHDVSTVGIWADGAPLNAESGTTVLAGHVNLVGQGNGALFDLARMQPGEIVRTSDESGAVTDWKVTRVHDRPKASGVDEGIFTGLEGPRRLAVVTCGGELTYHDGRGDYADNVYLYAVPVDQ